MFSTTPRFNDSPVPVDYQCVSMSNFTGKTPGHCPRKSNSADGYSSAQATPGAEHAARSGRIGHWRPGTPIVATVPSHVVPTLQRPRDYSAENGQHRNSRIPLSLDRATKKRYRNVPSSGYGRGPSPESWYTLKLCNTGRASGFERGRSLDTQSASHTATPLQDRFDAQPTGVSSEASVRQPRLSRETHKKRGNKLSRPAVIKTPNKTVSLGILDPINKVVAEAEVAACNLTTAKPADNMAVRTEDASNSDASSGDGGFTECRYLSSSDSDCSLSSTTTAVPETRTPPSERDSQVSDNEAELPAAHVNAIVEAVTLSESQHQAVLEINSTSFNFIPVKEKKSAEDFNKVMQRQAPMKPTFVNRHCVSAYEKAKFGSHRPARSTPPTSSHGGRRPSPTPPPPPPPPPSTMAACAVRRLTPVKTTHKQRAHDDLVRTQMTSKKLEQQLQLAKLTPNLVVRKALVKKSSKKSLQKKSSRKSLQKKNSRKSLRSRKSSDDDDNKCATSRDIADLERGKFKSNEHGDAFNPVAKECKVKIVKPVVRYDVMDRIPSLIHVKDASSVHKRKGKYIATKRSLVLQPSTSDRQFIESNYVHGLAKPATGKRTIGKYRRNERNGNVAKLRVCLLAPSPTICRHFDATSKSETSDKRKNRSIIKNDAINKITDRSQTCDTRQGPIVPNQKETYARGSKDCSHIGNDTKQVILTTDPSVAEARNRSCDLSIKAGNKPKVNALNDEAFTKELSACYEKKLITQFMADWSVTKKDGTVARSRGSEKSFDSNADVTGDITDSTDHNHPRDMDNAYAARDHVSSDITVTSPLNSIQSIGSAVKRDSIDERTPSYVSDDSSKICLNDKADTIVSQRFVSRGAAEDDRSTLCTDMCGGVQRDAKHDRRESVASDAHREYASSGYRSNEANNHNVEESINLDARNPNNGMEVINDHDIDDETRVDMEEVSVDQVRDVTAAGVTDGPSDGAVDRAPVFSRPTFFTGKINYGNSVVPLKDTQTAKPIKLSHIQTNTSALELSCYSNSKTTLPQREANDCKSFECGTEIANDEHVNTSDVSEFEYTGVGLGERLLSPHMRGHGLLLAGLVYGHEDMSGLDAIVGDTDRTMNEVKTNLKVDQEVVSDGPESVVDNVSCVEHIAADGNSVRNNAEVRKVIGHMVNRKEITDLAESDGVVLNNCYDQATQSSQSVIKDTDQNNKHTSEHVPRDCNKEHVKKAEEFLGDGIKSRKHETEYNSNDDKQTKDVASGKPEVISTCSPSPSLQADPVLWHAMCLNVDMCRQATQLSQSVIKDTDRNNKHTIEHVPRDCNMEHVKKAEDFLGDGIKSRKHKTEYKRKPSPSLHADLSLWHAMCRNVALLHPGGHDDGGSIRRDGGCRTKKMWASRRDNEGNKSSEAVRVTSRDEVIVDAREQQLDRAKMKTSVMSAKKHAATKVAAPTTVKSISVQGMEKELRNLRKKAKKDAENIETLLHEKDRLQSIITEMTVNWDTLQSEMTQKIVDLERELVEVNAQLEEEGKFRDSQETFATLSAKMAAVETERDILAARLATQTDISLSESERKLWERDVEGLQLAHFTDQLEITEVKKKLAACAAKLAVYEAKVSANINTKARQPPISDRISKILRLQQEVNEDMELRNKRRRDLDATIIQTQQLRASLAQQDPASWKSDSLIKRQLLSEFNEMERKREEHKRQNDLWEERILISELAVMREREKMAATLSRRGGTPPSLGCLASLKKGVKCKCAPVPTQSNSAEIEQISVRLDRVRAYADKNAAVVQQMERRLCESVKFRVQHEAAVDELSSTTHNLRTTALPCYKKVGHGKIDDTSEVVDIYQEVGAGQYKKN